MRNPFHRQIAKRKLIESSIKHFSISSREIQSGIGFFDDIYQVEKERKIENTINDIKINHGKNSVIRGMSLEEGATARLRNTLVGGHNG